LALYFGGDTVHAHRREQAQGYPLAVPASGEIDPQTGFTKGGLQCRCSAPARFRWIDEATVSVLWPIHLAGGMPDADQAARPVLGF